MTLAERLGADAAIDGRREDLVARARRFAPAGLDAALLIAGGVVAERALAAVREGGRAVHPKGVTPAPKARAGLSLRAYDGIRGPEASARLKRLIAGAPFEVHVADVVALDQVVDARRRLESHVIGKLALRLDV